MYSIAKKKREKVCKTALHGKMKERRETWGEWLIGAHVQNIPYLLTVTTQHNTRERHIKHLLIRVNVHRHVLVKGKTRRCAGV